MNRPRLTAVLTGSALLVCPFVLVAAYLVMVKPSALSSSIADAVEIPMLCLASLIPTLIPLRSRMGTAAKAIAGSVIFMSYAGLLTWLDLQWTARAIGDAF